MSTFFVFACKNWYLVVNSLCAEYSYRTLPILFQSTEVTPCCSLYMSYFGTFQTREIKNHMHLDIFFLGISLQDFMSYYGYLG